ncbi:MAG: hypothetical protein ACW99J_17540 [Candidatus Thorarchaeota archaeon]|jgi:hypothetical protein
MRFKIFYGDETTFSDEDGTIFEASTINVQGIAHNGGGRGWHVASHNNFYVWRKDMGFFGVDRDGMRDYLRYPGMKCVMEGRTISSPLFQEIHQRALAYADRKRREENAD